MLFVHTNSFAQKKRTIDFIGGARSFISNNEIIVRDSLPDTVSIKRNTGGYALIDLGVQIRPNKNTEIMGMFRIRNNYGGFWGAGVTFDVRQLWLKGVVGNVLRYQLGDLNLKQTQFTLYNHEADRFDSLPAIFRLQTDIIAYERFYQRNTWRQQGASVDFGLTFSNFIQKMDFSGYMTRLRASNFSTVPDRLMGGFSTNITQSKHFKIGFNGFYVFDVKGTVPDTSVYTNNVNTINASYATHIKKNILSVHGEAGHSTVQTTRDIKASALSDYFGYAYAKFSMPEQFLEVSAGYMNVGPDFRSVGAQSKNVNYDAPQGFYNRYGNDQTSRPIDLMDMVRNENIYTTSANSGMMNINPVYNNVLPFGLATFNREGVFGKLSLQLPVGISIRAEHFNLSEIRGQGTFQLKKFTQTKLISTVEINKLAKFKRLMKLQVGANYQTTQRNSSIVVENVNLTSLQYQAGLEFEVLKSIDLLAGIIGINTRGNDFMAERNSYTTIDFFNNNQYDLTQQIMAFGARCRFNEQIYLCAMYQFSKYQDRLKLVPDYDVNQFSLIYNMLF